MINKKRVSLKLDKSKEKLLSNFFFLATAQGLTFILPLLLTPFIIKLVGVEKYASIMLCQAIMTYFNIFTDYGFNLSATQQCSINRNNVKQLSQIVNKVLFTKLFLLLVGFIFLVFIIFLVPYFINIKYILLISYSIVIAKVLQPTWFFQGVEDMKTMAIFVIIAKTILIILFFVVYNNNNKESYLYLNLVFAVGDIIVGLGSLYYIRYFILKKEIVIVSFNEIILSLKRDFLLFWTNFTNNIYMNSNIILLSLFVNAELVGFYAIAEKIMVTFKNLAAVILQTTYPRACNLAVESLSKLKVFLKYEFYLFGLLFFSVGAVNFIFSDKIVLFFMGNNNQYVINYVRYLSFVPLIVSLNMPAYKVLIIYQLKNVYSSIVSVGAVINVLLNFLLIPSLAVSGTIFSIIITEIFITLSFHLIIYFKFPQYKFLS